MPFIHPAIFWTGLTAVSIPIVIHLLNRRRFRIRDWAAMQFVREAFRRHRRRLQIEQLILLALRCLVVFLLTMALARFAGCEALSVLPASDAGRTTVFVLDDSVSMGQKLGPTTAFDLATNDVVVQLELLPESEHVAILRTSDSAEAPLFGLDFATDRRSLTAKLRSLRPSDLQADLPARLTGVLGMLANQPGEKRVFIHGDFRRQDLTGDGAESLAEAIVALDAAGIDVVVMDYGQPATNNLTITSLELADKFVIAGVPVRIAATVRNNSPTTARDVEVQVKLRLPAPAGADEQKLWIEVELPTESIPAIDPGESRRVEFDVTCNEAGPIALVAELPPDDLIGDNAAFLDLQVRSALRVVVIDGRPNALNPIESESLLFAGAIDPGRLGLWGVRVDIVAVDSASAIRLGDYDVVVMLDVGELPSAIEDGRAVWHQVDALQRYVTAGGGLAIFTGEQANPSFYNGPMFAGGLGLSPFRIGPPRGDAAAREAFFRLDGESVDATHPVLQHFAGERIVATNFIRFFAFTPVEELPIGAAAPTAALDDQADILPPRVLARFTDDDHSPAIVARPFGRGQVVMIYTTASLRWNDWPDDQPETIFVAPMQDLIRYLARGPAERTSPPAGMQIAHLPTPEFRDAPATLKTPHYPESDLVMLQPIGRAEAAEEDLAAEDGGAEGDEGNEGKLIFRGSTEAGIYVMRISRPDGESVDVFFARNINPLEGELAPAGREGLRAAVGTDAMTYLQRTAGESIEAIQAGRKDEHWLWVLAALAAALAAETALALRFGHHAATANPRAGIEGRSQR